MPSRYTGHEPLSIAADDLLSVAPDGRQDGDRPARPSDLYDAMVEANRIIGELQAALSAEVASRDQWQCGNGAALGTGNCVDCNRHRRSLAALGRNLPTQEPCEDIEMEHE